MCESYDEKSKSIGHLNSSYLKDINYQIYREKRNKRRRIRNDETPVDMFDIETILKEWIGNSFFLSLTLNTIGVSK